MKSGRTSNSQLLFAYLGLVAFVLSIQLSLHFLPDVIAKHAQGMNLQGSWKARWSDSDGSFGARPWATTSFPGTVSKKDAVSGSVLYLEKEFPHPEICGTEASVCTLFIGTVSDPASVFVNGTLVGRIGDPGRKKSYTQTFPINILIPPGIIKGLNQLQIQIHPNYLGNQGLIRGPIHLFSADTAAWVSRIVIAQTIALPLISGIILLLVFFVTVLVCACGRTWDAKVYSFLGYCLTMGMYLISLTRLPREVLSPQIGIALHFALRVITEYFHLGLVIALFEKRIRWVILAQYYSLALFFLLLLPIMAPVTGLDLSSVGDLGRWLYRWNGALFVIPPVLSIYLICSMEKELRRSFLPLGALYAIVCGMIVSDFLAINGVIEDIYFVRFYPLLVALGYCSALWMSYSEQREKKEMNAALGELSSQVAHDIRSPLSALNVVSEDLKDIPDTHKILLRGAVERINDIANGLLISRKAPLADSEEIQFASAAEDCWIWGTVSALVSEKRLEYRPQSNVRIEFRPSAGSHGLFARLNAGDLKRVLSNLVNNSVEALPSSGGLVSIGLENGEDGLRLCVSDNGQGIPEALIDRLCNEGVTVGKKTGSGLGLFHARKIVESWGGRFTIQSEMRKGTTVMVVLPKVDAPLYWVQELIVRSGARFVIVDDDKSILEIWKKRLTVELKSESFPELIYFSSPSTFVDWWERQGTDQDLVLLDYEFPFVPDTGLDLVRRLNLYRQAILVTSRSEQGDVVDSCRNMGLRLIPKPFVAHVPLTIDIPRSKGVDAVLVDDDLLVQTAWILSAKRNGKNLKACSSIANALEAIESLPRHTPIYLDFHLPGGCTGIAASETFHNRGFSYIYLTTGRDMSESIAGIPWIKGALGKNPPWSTI